MNRAYRTLLTDLVNDGVKETNRRTGAEIYTLPGAQFISVSLVRGLLPMPTNRRYFTSKAAAEVAWQFSGTQDASFIINHAPKLWKDFAVDGKIETAYGYRWREHFGRDQIALAIHELKTNPTNRQLFISAWDARKDGLGGPQPLNVPCPIGFHVSAVNGELHGAVMLRSSDVYMGLPYDIMAYCLTIDAMAVSARLRPGRVSFMLAHAHLYANHLESAQECLDDLNWPSHASYFAQLPSWSVEDIVDEPDEYVAAATAMSSTLRKVDYSPQLELVL